MNFREQIVERFLVNLGEADVPRGNAEAFASDVIHLLDRLTQDRHYDAAMRQILQRFAREWAEQNSRRVLEGGEDGATDIVYEMIDRQGRNRAVRALRQALLDVLEGRQRPLDDLDFFGEE